MNICFVYKLYPLDKVYDSGIGRYLSDLADELKQNHKVVILTTADKPRIIKSKNLIIYAIKYPRINNRSMALFIHLFNVAVELAKIITKEKIDLIEFSNWESEGILFTLIMNKFYKIPVVIRLVTPSAIDHKFNSSAKYLSENIKEYLEKLFVNQKENFLTTTTKYNATVCQNIYSIDKSKPIDIIPLGIKSVENIHPPKNSQSTNILYVGRLEPRKGIDILIKSIPMVLNKNNNFNFMIVGRDNYNNKWLDDLKNSIPYDYLKKVHFLGYINNPKTLKKLYMDADICVVPSRYESFGLTVLEAMSYGKIVIANHRGGIPEIIIDKFNGILIKKLTAKKLAHTIIDSVHIKSEIRINALNTIKERLNSIKMAQNSLSLYKKLIGQ
jgi:glycosyltransferase involved in cell wall biosynthesis